MDRFPTPEERRRRKIIETELNKGKVLVHFDPRYENVRVPENLKSEPVLALNFSHHFPLANTTLAPLSLEANLSFSGVRYWCAVTYESIFCISPVSDKQPHWFLDSLPEEFRSAISGQADIVAPDRLAEPDIEAPHDEAGAPDASEAKVSHLKLVK
jgi:hypothetical protein